MLHRPNSKLLASIYRVKPYIPSILWRGMTTPYWWWYNRARHQAAAIFSQRRRESIRRLETYRDKHKGERCFIIGNGPSLQQTNLKLLKDEVTFGMNRIYLWFNKIGFPTTYFVAINTLVIEQIAQEIMTLEIPKFITWRGRKWLAKDSNIVFVDTDYTPPATFSENVSKRVFEGSTVTYVALQIAFHMGFEEVILVGVDHHFVTKGPPNVPIVSNGKDPDHFSPDYFGKGFRWQLPDLAASEEAYLLAREAYEAAGRTVLDATIGGKLTIFPKVTYEDLLNR